MWKSLLLVLACSAAQAAVIRGTITENQTGRPLARARVALQPVTGSGGGAASTRTNQYGTFEFSGLPAGSYVVTASRTGFPSWEYGQKRWKAAGTPVTVDANAAAVLSIALPRFGAILGTVFDENDVGLPEHDVVAYRASRPLQVASRARTDDRGRYRLSGLEPGRYWVRTAAKLYEEGGYVPTFHLETARLDEALVVDVELDHESPEVNVRPFPGRLFTLTGQVIPPTQTNVSLISDTGVETTVSDSAGSFQFNALASGEYELYAQAPADSRLGVQAAYQPLVIGRDRTQVRLILRPLPQVQFSFRDNKGQMVDYHSLHLIARRRDMAGASKPQTLELSSDRLAFLPGRWELALAPTPDYFVSGFLSPQSLPGEARRADGWNEVVLNGPLASLQFILSTMPGAIHGMVTGSGHEPAPGAPVYLEAYDFAERRSLRDVQTTHADSRGQYRFTGLVPGNYRLVSSFDFEEPENGWEIRGVKTLKVEEGRESVQDLDLP